MKNLTKILLSIYVAIMMIAVACKKENTVSPEICQVISSKYYDATYKKYITTKYDYNSDGKVSKISNDRDGSYTTISYSSTAIVTTDFDKNNKQLYTQNYILNAMGYVIKSGATSNFPYTYEYDSQGYFIKGFNSEYTETNTYTDGNLTTNKVTYTNSGKFYGSTTYDYYLDKPNTLTLNNFSSLSAYSYGISIDVSQNLTGKKSKNLVKKTTTINYFANSTTDITDYTYTFDSKGNPTQAVAKSSNGYANTIDIEYLCK
jgi:Domain of unknown function (DUF4595) with porin-like fold